MGEADAGTNIPLFFIHRTRNFASLYAVLQSGCKQVQCCMVQIRSEMQNQF